MLLHPSKFLLILLSLLFFNTSQASHVLGGEISWECLNNGKYVFTLDVYRDCSGIQFSFANRSIEIIGNPLPKDASNNSISQFALKADTANWSFRREGNISPICFNDGGFDCSANDIGSVQKLTFVSDTITLAGTPPVSGWEFYHQLPCCRPNTTNLASGGTQMLRAIMYPNPNSNAPNQCDDSSPSFSEFPEYLVCRGQVYDLDFSARDEDFDSLSYHFDRTYNSPPFAPQPVPYAAGYNFNNPTPDTSFNVNNLPAKLDSTSGIIRQKINNGNPLTLDYTIVVRVDSWRAGNRISSTFREIPVTVFDCPTVANQIPNAPPIIQAPFVSGPNQMSFKDTVVAGNAAIINLSVMDTNRTSLGFQTIKIEMWGNRLANDLISGSDCPDPADSTCAVFYSVPRYDNLRKRYYYQASPAWNSFVSWQTDCGDLDSNGNARTHRFVIRASDDHCPIPGQRMEVIEITVLPSVSLCPNVSTSVSEAEPDLDQINIYPNPTNGRVFIDGASASSMDYLIFNIQGKLMKRGRLAANQNQLLLPEAEGLYFVSIRDGEGNERTYKLVKN